MSRRAQAARDRKARRGHAGLSSGDRRIRRTARFSIGNSASSSGRAGRHGCRAERFPQGHRRSIQRCGVAGPDRARFSTRVATSMRALKAYDDALALEPNGRVEAKRNALVTRAEAARLPAEYRAIERRRRSREAIWRRSSASAWRRCSGDPPARSRRDDRHPRSLGRELDSGRRPRRRSCDPFANHTFQPRTIVRRVDLAQAIDADCWRKSRWSRRRRRERWANARGRFTDIAAGHLAYPAASTAVAAGVMAAAPRRRVSAVAGGDRRGSDRSGRAPPRDGQRLARRRRRPAMTVLTVANQLTLLRMHADSGVRDSGDLRPSRVGAGRVRDGRSHRCPGRTDRATVGAEEHARRLAGSDGRQTARAEHVHRADGAVAWPRQSAADLAHGADHQP